MQVIDQFSMPYEQKKKLRKFVRGMIRLLPPFFSLKSLALINGTDKLAHGYIPHYHSHFRSMRNRRLKILEIGVGGYDDPHVGGSHYGCGVTISERALFSESISMTSRPMRKNE